MRFIDVNPCIEAHGVGIGEVARRGDVSHNTLPRLILHCHLGG